LLDRAHFIGDLGRTGKNKQNEPTSQDASSFQKALKKKVDKDEPEEAAKADEKGEKDAPPPEDPNDPNVKDPNQERTATAELESRIQGQEEGEKFSAGAGSTWRGPNPLFGLAFIPTVQPMLASAVTAGEGSRADQQSEKVEEVSSAEARVDAGVLLNLQEAGLEKPLRGLDDPRLAGGKPALEAEDGWRSGPIPGGTNYTWEAPGRTAYQRLEWTDVRTLLESAGGTTLQTLERKGGQLFARLKRRTTPQPKSFEVAED
jgi:hypothetical protein